VAESLSTEQQIPFDRWVSLDEALPLLRERMGFNDGGRYISTHWGCKYINARIDMRTGAVYLKPGNEAAVSTLDVGVPHIMAAIERGDK
jgi:hypothetical protein